MWASNLDASKQQHSESVRREMKVANLCFSGIDCEHEGLTEDAQRLSKRQWLHPGNELIVSNLWENCNGRIHKASVVPWLFFCQRLTRMPCGAFKESCGFEIVIMAQHFSPLGRAALTMGSAAVALANPARADMVALLGDLTSGPTLTHLTNRLQSTREGREMLATLTPTRFPENGSASLPALRALPDGTLGREYARFMDVRAFTPESRDVVRFVDDDRHRWVLQRYRDVHDLWHVLTGMPTTFLGELAQKWFEAAQTGLPVTVLSALFGPLRLRAEDRRVLVKDLIPWAISCGRGAEDLLAVRYEDYLESKVTHLRSQWGITIPNVHIKGMRKPS